MSIKLSTVVGRGGWKQSGGSGSDPGLDAVHVQGQKSERHVGRQACSTPEVARANWMLHLRGGREGGGGLMQAIRQSSAALVHVKVKMVGRGEGESF